MVGRLSPLGPRRAPRPFLVHAALVCAQVFFGGGAVVGKFGIHGTNPLLFALVRDGVAGPILYLASCLATKELRPCCRDVPRLFVAALGLFSSQVLMTAGLKLADPVTASAWQPSQPIFTAVLAISAGYELVSTRKVLGILAAVSGAVFMVTWGSSGRTSSSDAWKMGLVGNVFFALNCFGTSVYVVVSKELLRRYPSLCVTAWSYLTTTLFILAAACVVNGMPGLLEFFCTDGHPEVQRACVAGAWSVPAPMLLPLAYWILFQSILSYVLMTWANQYAQASVVSVYTVLQPLTSGSISAVLVLVRGRAWADAYGLESPGVQDLGVLGIALGLGLLFTDRSTSLRAACSEGEADKRQALADSADSVAAPQVENRPSNCLLET